MYAYCDYMEIYKGIKDNNLSYCYRELEPYKKILRTIFSEVPLYRNIDSTPSEIFIIKMIDLVGKIPVEETKYLNERLLKGYRRYSIESVENYYKTLLNPKENTYDMMAYLESFSYIFDCEISVKAAQVDLSKFRNLDSIMQRAFANYHDWRYRLLVEVVTACYYANQDEFDISVLDKFYNNINLYLEHWEFNKCEDLDGRLTLRNALFISKDSFKTVEMLYNYVLDCLSDIKNSSLRSEIR